MPLQIESPLWLAGLLVSAYAFWSLRPYARAAGTRLSRPIPYLRAAAIACVTLALAGLTWNQVVPGVDFHVALDRSASVDGASQERAEAFLRALSARLGPSDRIALYSFGRDVITEQTLSPALALQAFQSAPDATATDIERAIRTALLRMDPAANSRIVLVSDGVETVGHAFEAAAAARALNTPIDVYPLASLSAGEAAVERLLAPDAVAPDEPFTVRAVVSSTDRTPARLTLLRDGEILASRDVDLVPGRNVITLAELRESVELGTAAAHFEVRLQAELDTFRENNVGYAIVRRLAEAPVLVLSQDLTSAALIRRSLEAQGLTADVSALSEAPLDLPSLVGYRAVILDNVPANALTQRQLENLASFVENHGGGLLIAGGPHSFGLGGYHRTPLERLSPVAMDAPQDVIMPSLAMVLILDRSGSMAETQGAFSKLDLAKEAALGVLDVINENDLLGVIAFDSQARWIVPVQTVESRISFAASIASLAPEGGTNLEPALKMASAAMEAVEASVKHVIVLTDGRSTQADFESLTADLRSKGASLSTVGVGRDADRELLEKMALWGEGRFYYSDDIHAIPQIFATETLMVARPIRVDQSFVPRWDQRADFWFYDEALPALGGYVITTPKATAAVHLRGPDGSPILATWRYGLGRTAAFMASMVGTWADRWPEWPGYQAFWGQLVRWLMKPTPTSGLLPELVIDDGIATLAVDALDDEGRYLNFLGVTGVVNTPDGDRFNVALEQVGPGRYEGTFPTRAQGAYTVTVRADSHGPALESIEPATTGAVVSYPDEFRIMDSDPSLLYRLASTTGGVVLRGALDSLFTHPSPGSKPRPLGHWLLALAFLLFLTDVALRYLPGRGLGDQIKGRIAAARNAWDDDTSPEEELRRRLEERQRAARASSGDGSSIDQTAKQQGAGRYLASRRKKDRGDRGGA